MREYDARGLACALGGVFARVQVRGMTATPVVLEIEKRRVRQNPFVAYPKMIAQMALPNRVRGWLKQIGARVDPSTAVRAGTFDPTKFAVDDFRVSENELRGCINLVAIC